MVTNSWMQVLTPRTQYFPDSSWLSGPKRSGNWTQEENKRFEDALAQFDRDTPDRWDRVAAMIPGKSVRDIISHYRDLEEDVNDIEAGRIPFPVYSSSSFTLDWDNSHGYEGLKPSYCVGGKRSGGRSDQERKKGVPWTEEEHKLFLLGLQKYGKGDWRNISRNFVITRTPTQVASHAQKYFIRLNSGGKDKRRSSIHDITTVNLPNNGPPSPSQASVLARRSSSTGISEQYSVMVDSNQPDEPAGVFSPSAHATRKRSSTAMISTNFIRGFVQMWRLRSQTPNLFRTCHLHCSTCLGPCISAYCFWSLSISGWNLTRIQRFCLHGL